jgi:hypothetical protein
MLKPWLSCGILALLVLGAGPTSAQASSTRETLMQAVQDSQIRIDKPTEVPAAWRALRPYLERWHGLRVQDSPGCLAANLPSSGGSGSTVGLVWDFSNHLVGNQLEIGLRALDALNHRFPAHGKIFLVACSNWAELEPSTRQALLSCSSVLMPVPSEQLTTHECCLPYPLSSNRLDVVQVKMLTNPQKLDPRVSLGYSLLGFQSLGFDEADDCEMRLERFQDQSAFISLKSHSDKGREHFIGELSHWVRDNAPRSCEIEVTEEKTAAAPPTESPDIALIRRIRETFRSASDDCTLTREPPFEANVDLAALLGNQLTPVKLFVSSQLDSASASWAEAKSLQVMLGVEKPQG